MTTGSATVVDLSALAPAVDWDHLGQSAHLVQFYDDDRFLLDAVGRFFAAGLGAGEAAILIATPAHVRGFEERLRAAGIDVDAARAEGRYLSLDAADTLSKLLVGGQPNEERFAAVIGALIARTAARFPHVRAFGEMVALLWADMRPEAAIRLETLWTDLSKELPFSLVCSYPMDGFRDSADGQPFLKICAAHSHVVPAESYTSLATADERLRTISRLQQKASAFESEAAERKQAERSLHRRQKELADFLENAIEGLHQVGPDGTILWANKAQLDLLGYAANEYVGRNIADFHADRRSFEEIWQRLMRHESVYDYPADLLCKDGSIRNVLIHSNGLWEDGRFVYTRCFIRDVTERTRLEDELKARIDQLAEADRRKDEFLAMLGHELRNPLSAVRNAIATASLDSSRRSRALDIARRQADQLGRLIDDLLDVARITQGRITLRKENLRLASIVERAVDTTRPFIEDRGQRLSVSLAEEEIRVDADAGRLEQVIVNLLTNAAKYTEPGGRIEVVGEVCASEAVLRVRDSGIGIPPEVLPRIFDLFAQGDRSLDRSEGGLGVGLTIARRLVEQHGGRIEAHSAGPGKGSEFIVRLPGATLAEHEPEASRAQSMRSGRARIVIVEDNADAAESLMMLLELLGHYVRVFPGGASALEAARTNVPDVMLIDIGLPGIDGYEVARRVRRDAALKHVVLVALTGYGREEDAERALAAGFDHHIVKPVSVETLQDLVSRLARPDAGDGPTLQ